MAKLIIENLQTFIISRWPGHISCITDSHKIKEELCILLQAWKIYWANYRVAGDMKHNDVHVTTLYWEMEGPQKAYASLAHPCPL